MKQEALKTEQYTAGAQELTADELDHYGRRIVSSAIALSLLSKRAGKELNRSIIPQMCRYGRLHPMGKYKNVLYFWRHEVESVPLQAEKTKAKKTA